MAALEAVIQRALRFSRRPLAEARRCLVGSAVQKVGTHTLRAWLISSFNARKNLRKGLKPVRLGQGCGTKELIVGELVHVRLTKEVKDGAEVPNTDLKRRPRRRDETKRLLWQCLQVLEEVAKDLFKSHSCRAWIVPPLCRCLLKDFEADDSGILRICISNGLRREAALQHHAPVSLLYKRCFSNMHIYIYIYICSPPLP